MAAPKVTVFFLEMLSHNQRTVPAPRAGLSILQVHQPTVDDCFRFLNDSFLQKRALPAHQFRGVELASIVGDRSREVHVLLVDGVPGGLAELDRSIPGQVELSEFGLLRKHIGKGLGKYFLQWTTDRVWSYKPTRFWLRTSTLDHPAALPNYLKAGFTLFHESTEEPTALPDRSRPARHMPGGPSSIGEKT